LHAVSKKEGWTGFNIFRSALVAATGVSMGLVPLVIRDQALFSSAWAVPVTAVLLMLVLLITHIPIPRGVGRNLSRNMKKVAGFEEYFQ